MAEEAMADVEAAPLRPEEVNQIVARFEKRIEAGEFGYEDDSFHRAVLKELYPLLGGGDLSRELFSALVKTWAKRVRPNG